MAYKPERYSSVSPYLIVYDAQETMEFLAKVFGAESLRVYRADNGKVMHGEVRVDDTVLMLSDATDGCSAVSSYVHVYVPDVETTYRKAIAAGAVSLQQPVKKDDTYRRAGFKDSGGTMWWIGTQID